ncbi:MAG TPA: tachylectin-related carbohydrate-binding protein [Pyrinomonadaceae bacterium]|nr:tachylectin-related carbohydrate-binding protein [Pyrinomonadaceae bacterium]
MNNISLKLTVAVVALFLIAATAPTNAQPQAKSSYIYGIEPDGKLMWSRHVGADSGLGLETAGAWQGANQVGRGWNGFLSVIPGGLNIIYLIRPDGTLDWRQHLGARTGLTEWGPAKVVGRGWNGFKQVFSGGDGILYVIEGGGKLRWYKHNGYQTGAGMESPGAWDGPREVGRGWGDFKLVFGGGKGIIYAITNEGKLLWCKHNGYQTGAGLETAGAWEGPKEVGRGWGDFKNVFSAGDGIIYAITEDGKLLWYKHNGYQDGRGLESAGAWENPKQVGRGWEKFDQVFALLPGSISRTPSSSTTSGDSDSTSDGPGQPAIRSKPAEPEASFPLSVRSPIIIFDMEIERGRQLMLSDPKAVELFQQQPLTARYGFLLGMAIAEHDTSPGPGKQKIHDSLSPEEQLGFDAAVTFTLSKNRERNAALAEKGEAIANQDPLALALRNLQPEGLTRRGFDIGMAAAERDTEPGPDKQRIHDSLLPAEQTGFTTALTFLLARNKNAKIAAVGAAIAESDAGVARVRSVDGDPFFQLGFDIASGLFGDPAQGSVGSTQLGPGGLAIRAGLNAAGQRGFDASMKFHFGRTYR